MFSIPKKNVPEKRGRKACEAGFVFQDEGVASAVRTDFFPSVLTLAKRDISFVTLYLAGGMTTKALGRGGGVWKVTAGS